LGNPEFIDSFPLNRLNPSLSLIFDAKEALIGCHNQTKAKVVANDYLINKQQESIKEHILSWRKNEVW